VASSSVTQVLNATPLVLRSRGQVLLSDDIQFENVPIVTPNGDILLRSLTFHVKPGVRLSAMRTYDILC
jgi:ABC-type uncharacterized transport system fused permease/ATPase subunit